MATLKDKITNICSSVIAIAAAIGTFAVTMNLPVWVVASCGLVAAIATAVIGYFTGKGADGKSIIPAQ
jgi:hypothetical protein